MNKCYPNGEYEEPSIAFAKLKDNPMYKSAYKKLTKQDVAWCSEFLKKHEVEGIDHLSFLINRLWIDKEKPKNHKPMWVLLCAAAPRVIRR